MMLNIDTFLLTTILVVIIIILYLIIRALGGLKKLNPFYFILGIVVFAIVFGITRQSALDYTYKHFPYTQPNTEWLSDSGTITIFVSDEEYHSNRYGGRYDYKVYVVIGDDCYAASIGMYSSESALPLSLTIDDSWPFDRSVFSFRFRMPNDHTLILLPKDKEATAPILAGQDKIVLTRTDSKE